MASQAYIVMPGKSLSKKEIDQIFAKNKSRIKKYGLEIILAPSNFYKGRIVVITPKVIANAPKRNQIRRRLKAIFYEEQIYTNKQDYIVIVRKPALNLDYQTLKKILISCLN